MRHPPVLVLTALAVGSYGQNIVSTAFATGFSKPVAMIQNPADRNVQFVVEQDGVVRVINNGVKLPTPFLNLSNVVAKGGEKGLLGLAFPHDYATSGFFYVNYSLPGQIMQVSRFKRSNGNPLVADPNSGLVIIRTERPFENHNGGTIVFGPDRMLYIAMGDGGGSGDPNNLAQNRTSLLGKMLRIDPRVDRYPSDPLRNYGVPANNPFMDGLPVVARGEIWSFGLRNPWKFSFDNPNWLGTGAMIVGDVGQNSFEEINYEPAAEGGRNYGWKRFEGNSLFSNTLLAFGPHSAPAFVYGRSEGQSVTGGHVYRGLELGPDYFGRYFFGDFVASRLWSGRFTRLNTGQWTLTDIRDHSSTAQPGQVSSIDIDLVGELYVCSYPTGTVRKLALSNATYIFSYAFPDTRQIGGTLRHLIASDSNVVRLVPPTTSQRSTNLVGIFKTTRATRSTVSVTAVGAHGIDAPLTLDVFLKRWSDGQFLRVGQFSMDGSRRVFKVNGRPAATFVRASDGRIEAKLTTTRPGIISTVSQVFWDQIRVDVQ